MKDENKKKIITGVFLFAVSWFVGTIGVGNYWIDSVLTPNLNNKGVLISLFFSCWLSALLGYSFMGMAEYYANNNLYPSKKKK